MTITTGSRIGPYEVTSQLGAGGMGVVFRATDTKLDRQVAIKVLPEHLASESERLSRFKREAQALAALNHPNVAQIYGLEESESNPCIVMELVHGETLREIISRGAIPLDDALKIAKQIARALEAAHEKGIVHRDLKPANIKVLPDGTVKVLDFGLARILEAESTAVNVSQSPTLMGVTGGGVLLGTAAYMSPEQARGRAVDRRCDIWALGCVMYEMVMGTQAFAGETITDILAAVVKTEPDWTGLAQRAPHRFIEVLRGCLRKDPADRFHDAADVRILIDESIAAPAPSTTIDRSRSVSAWLLLPAVSLALIAGSIGAWLVMNNSGSSTLNTATTRFSISLGDDQLRPRGMPFAISRGGASVVYTNRRRVESEFMLRTRDRLETISIDGTASAVNPFFSADGRTLAFFATGKLKKVSMTGGAPSTIADVAGSSQIRGATWSSNDTIVYAVANGISLWKVLPGGVPQRIPVASDLGDNLWWPDFLPDGKNVLATLAKDRTRAVGLIDIESGIWQPLIEGGSQPHYIEEGYIVFSRGADLIGAGFDSEALRLTTPQFSLLKGVKALTASLLERADYDISKDGALIYFPEGSDDRPLLSWVDPKGAATFLPAAGANDVVISPDGRQVALNFFGRLTDVVSVYDFDRGKPTRLTFEEGQNMGPVWSPDGKWIAYAFGSLQSNAFYRKPSDGSGSRELLYTAPLGSFMTSWHPDGSRILFQQGPDKPGWTFISFLSTHGNLKRF